MGLHCSAAGPKYQPQDVSSHEQSDSYSTEPQQCPLVRRIWSYFTARAGFLWDKPVMELLNGTRHYVA